MIDARELDSFLAGHGFTEIRLVGTERIYERAKASGIRVVVFTGLHRTFVPKQPKPMRVRLAWLSAQHVIGIWPGAIVEPTDDWPDVLLDRLREAWWRTSKFFCPRCGWPTIVLDNGDQHVLRCGRAPKCPYRGRSGTRELAPWRSAVRA